MASTKILPHGESRTAGRAAALDSCTGSAAIRKHLNKATKAEQLREFREYRWSARITVRRVLRGTRVSFCGNPVSDIVGQGLYYDDKHLSRFSGLAACGNVCCCPVCNFKIMSYRQKQISQALRTCKERKYGVVFATLTLRHKKGVNWKLSARNCSKSGATSISNAPLSNSLTNSASLVSSAPRK